MNKITVFILLVLSLGMTQTLSLRDYLVKATMNDFEINNILEAGKTITLDYLVSRPKDDWLFSLNSGLDFFSNQTIAPSFEINAQKLLETTDTIFGAGISRGKASESSSETQRFSVELSQPLGENHLGYQYKLSEKIRLLEAEKERLRLRDLYESRLEEIILLYYDWYLAYMEFQAEKHILGEYEKLLNDIKERRKNHIARDVEVNKVKIQVLEKGAGVIAKEQKFKNYSAEISLVIKSEEIFIPSFDNFVLKQTEDQEIYSSYFELNNVLELQISSLNIMLAQDKLNYPFSLGMSWQNTDTVGSSSSSASKVSIGLGIDFPKADKQEEASLQLLELAHEELLLLQEQKLLARDVLISEIIRDIETENKYKKMNVEKTKLLADILKEEKESYLRGQATLNQLIQAYNDLFLARQQLMKGQVNLEKYKIQFLSVTDQLVDQFIKEKLF